MPPPSPLPHFGERALQRESKERLLWFVESNRDKEKLEVEEEEEEEERKGGSSQDRCLGKRKNLNLQPEHLKKKKKVKRVFSGGASYHSSPHTHTPKKKTKQKTKLSMSVKHPVPSAPSSQYHYSTFANDLEAQDLRRAALQASADQFKEEREKGTLDRREVHAEEPSF